MVWWLVVRWFEPFWTLIDSMPVEGCSQFLLHTFVVAGWCPSLATTSNSESPDSIARIFPSYLPEMFCSHPNTLNLQDFDGLNTGDFCWRTKKSTQRPSSCDTAESWPGVDTQALFHWNIFSCLWGLVQWPLREKWRRDLDGSSVSWRGRLVMNDGSLWLET